MNPNEKQKEVVVVDAKKENLKINKIASELHANISRQMNVIMKVDKKLDKLESKKAKYSSKIIKINNQISLTKREIKNLSDDRLKQELKLQEVKKLEQENKLKLEEKLVVELKDEVLIKED